VIRKKKKTENMPREILEKLATLEQISKNSIRSIEEIAKLQRLIEGLGFGYLSPSQRKWLVSGGFDLLILQKPSLKPFLEELMKKKGEFPVSIYRITEKVKDRMKEKAQKGEIPSKYKNVIVSPSEVEAILRFKKDPWKTKSEKTKILAQTLVEILEEEVKENPRAKVVLEVAKKWKEWMEMALQGS